MTPDLLPAIPELRRITQALAMLDAILCPEWEYRYYSFNSKWGPGEVMASMRTGTGDDWFLLLDSAGAALKGFAHELAEDSAIAKNIQLQVPQVFSSFLTEPAFTMANATFCFWRQTSDSFWSKVSSTLDDDGSDEMLALLVSGAHGYRDWAEQYYETPVSQQAVARLFSHQPLTRAMLRELNADAEVESVTEDAIEIGYPLDASWPTRT